MTQLNTRRLRLLGPVRVDQFLKPQGTAVVCEAEGKYAGNVPRFRSRRTVALLGYLSAERRPIARHLLTALLWPDEAPAKGRANLRRELHNLAQILPDCWELDRQSVAFIPSPNTIVDLYQLLQLEAQEHWEEATELLGGEFLEGVYLDDNPEFENWLLGERERWRGRTQSILHHVIDGHTRRSRYTDALHVARRLLQLTPWDEEAHTQVMRLLVWTGQRGAALRQYETCKHTLWEELGVQPSVETIDLYQQIRVGELNLPPQLPAFLTEERPRREFEQPLFVARERELAQVDAYLEAVLDGQSQVIFITGGPGRGKTTLLGAFAQRAMEMHPNLLVASGKCNAYSGVGDPYLPYRDVMAMLTGDVEGHWDAGAISREHALRLWGAFPLIVQALLDHGPDLLDIFVPITTLLSRSIATGQDNPAWLPRLRAQIKRQEMDSHNVEQSHLFQQVTNFLRTIAQEQPLLLILDDIQWADAASISLLFHLGRRFADVDSRLLIACAYRPEEVALGRNGKRHPLAKVLSEFKHTYGDVWLDLGRVEEQEERRFVDALLDVIPNRLANGFRTALFDRTGGHPLFTVELLHAMQDRNDLIKDTDDLWIEGPRLDWEVLPARVEAVIEERIDRLDQGLQDILTIACVEGEVFTAQVIAEVQSVSERSILRRLSQDLERRHRLVREQGEVETDQRRMSRYRFGHVLYQDYLYKRLSQGEKRLLHADVAAALEELYAGQLDEMAVQLAHHFHLAGDLQQALHYFSLAGERADRLYESGEAITHYTRAIQLAERISPDAVSLAQLHRGRGMALERLGEFDQAHTDYTAILNLDFPTGEHQVKWRALLDLGRLWTSRDYNRAHDCFQEALELAQQMGDQTLLASSLNWMGNWYLNAENPKAAIKHHQDALAIFEQLGDRRNLATTLDLLGIASLLAGEITAMVAYYDRAILLFRELGDQSHLVSSLTGRGHAGCSTYLSLATLSPVIAISSRRDFEEAVYIAREIGSLADEAWIAWSLGTLLMVQGCYGQALDVIQRGLEIATQIGHREWIVGNRYILGFLYVELLAPEDARRELELALTLAEELRSRTWIHNITGILAAAYCLNDNLAQAQTCLETVLSLHTPMDTLGIRICWARRAELALCQGDPALALDILDHLITSASGMAPGRVITFLWKVKGEALAAIGDTESACSLLRAAIKNAQSTKERFLLWRLHASLGRLYHTMGRQQDAEKEFLNAHELIQELVDTMHDGELSDNFLQRAHERLRNSQ